MALDAVARLLYDTEGFIVYNILVSVRMSDIGCSEVCMFSQHTVPDRLSGDKITY